MPSIRLLILAVCGVLLARGQVRVDRENLRAEIAVSVPGGSLFVYLEPASNLILHTTSLYGLFDGQGAGYALLDDVVAKRAVDPRILAALGGKDKRYSARGAADVFLGRPAVSPQVRDLIRRLSRDNPLWGAPRVHGELLKLGIDIGETSVGKYMVRRRKPPSSPSRRSVELFDYSADRPGVRRRLRPPFCRHVRGDGSRWGWLRSAVASRTRPIPRRQTAIFACRPAGFA